MTSELWARYCSILAARSSRRERALAKPGVFGSLVLQVGWTAEVVGGAKVGLGRYCKYRKGSWSRRCSGAILQFTGDWAR
jgi:hypothetical protein